MTDTATPTSDTAPDTTAWLEPDGMGRTIVLGSVVGTVLAFVAITVLVRLADVEWWSALGLGAFIAFWGGLGFGSMVAGVVWASRDDVAAHSSGHASSHGPATAAAPEAAGSDHGAPASRAA